MDRDLALRLLERDQEQQSAAEQAEDEDEVIDITERGTDPMGSVPKAMRGL